MIFRAHFLGAFSGPKNLRFQVFVSTVFFLPSWTTMHDSNRYLHFFSTLLLKKRRLALSENISLVLVVFSLLEMILLLIFTEHWAETKLYFPFPFLCTIFSHSCTSRYCLCEHENVCHRFWIYFIGARRVWFARNDYVDFHKFLPSKNYLFIPFFIFLFVHSS